MTKEEIYSWIEDLYPLNRSIVGRDYDESLNYLMSKMVVTPNILSIPSGETADTWKIPQGWKVNSAFIKRLNGEIILDFNDSNLHVWSHSQGFSGIITREELFEHLLSIPESPKAIPYSTTYYEKKWGLSISHEVFSTMTDQEYEVLIDVDFYDHELKIMELIIPGETQEEILFSTYLCHPSMVNNELSGPVLMTALINYIAGRKNRYSYRFIIAPETIGSIFYIHRNLNELRTRTLMAWNLTCVGDPNGWSLLQSQDINSIPNLISKAFLKSYVGNYSLYTFNERGSDERQYSSPQVRIPMVSIMRSKYTEFPEYHTSLDNLDFVTPESMFESFNVYTKLLDYLQLEGRYYSNFIGEPFLLSFFERKKIGGRFEGYTKDIASLVNHFIAFSDGRSLFEIAEALQVSLETVSHLASIAIDHKMVKVEAHSCDDRT